MAHVGGFVFGVVVAFILKKTGVINPNKYKVVA